VITPERLQRSGRVLQHRVTTTYRFASAGRGESASSRPVRKIVVRTTDGVPLSRGVPMLSVQDDLTPASGIVIGVSIGTAIWEVAIFVVWHFM
jgi:hypothetical protein